MAGRPENLQSIATRIAARHLGRRGSRAAATRNVPTVGSRGVAGLLDDSEQLRDGTLAAIPVIILSGAGDVGKEAAALGAAGYVTKPFNIESLLGVVQQSCHPS